jgi:hypothetical protein
VSRPKRPGNTPSSPRLFGKTSTRSAGRRNAWRLNRCAVAEAEDGDNPATLASVDRARASAHNSFCRLLSDPREFQSDRWLRAEVLGEGFDEAYIGMADRHRVINA